MNKIKTFSCLWMFFILIFSCIPQTLLNYNFNYCSFAIIPSILLFFFFCSLMIFWPNKNFERTNNVFVYLLPIFALVVFWFFRTQIHIFGGDGAVGILPTHFPNIFAVFPSRLDGLLISPLFYGLCQTSIFSNFLTMPSILATQIHSIIMGVLFVSFTCFFFKKNWLLGMLLLTYSFIFNFFGNIDSYTFSLLYGLLFLGYCLYLNKKDSINFWQLLLLGLLWGIGLWTHPFHLFSGFIVTYFCSKWADQKLKIKTEIPAIILYGIGLFIFIKLSPFGASFFAMSHLGCPPAFSYETFCHYLNMILLPIIPLFFFLYKKTGISKVFLMYGMASLSFFIMAFTLGTVDQFNYQHLFFFFLMPFILFLAKNPIKSSKMKALIVINLFCLIPMIFVHTTSLTIKRSEVLSPIDNAAHNYRMSWQTHMGLVLGDNFSENELVKKATLSTFENGAKFAKPDNFKIGNYLYFIAFHYNYGEFEKGKVLLIDMLRRYPQTVSVFLNDRPGFIFFNREILWNDIIEIYPYQDLEQKNALIQLINVCRTKAKNDIYYINRPKYAISSY